LLIILSVFVVKLNNPISGEKVPSLSPEKRRKVLSLESIFENEQVLSLNLALLISTFS